MCLGIVREKRDGLPVTGAGFVQSALRAEGGTQIEMHLGQIRREGRGLAETFQSLNCFSRHQQTMAKITERFDMVRCQRECLPVSRDGGL